MTAADAGWRAAERWVWERVVAGEEADFNVASPSVRDASDVAAWTDDPDSRTVRSTTIATMLFDAPWRDALPATGLKLRGALIPGGLDLMHLRLARPVWLEGCRIEGDLNLEDGQIEGQFSLDGSWIGGATNLKCGRFGFLSFVGTRFGGDLMARLAHVAFEFVATGARVRGDMLIGEITVGSELHLEGARITGTLNCDLIKAGMVVLGQPGVPTVVGRGIAMSGASIASQLFLGPLGVAAVPGEPAMVAQGMNVAAALVVQGVSARSNIDLSFSKFGSVDFNRAPSRLWRVEMHGVVVAGEFVLHAETQWRPGARLNLRNARVGAVQDDLGESWPASLYLHGFDPGRLGALGGQGTSYMTRPAQWFVEFLGRTAEVQQNPPALLWPQLPQFVRRIWPVPDGAPGWLCRLLVPVARDVGYRPSTYITFAERLRALGRVGPADLVAYEGREIDRRNAIFPRNLGLWMLRATMGYGIGYRYFRALYWVVGLAALCLVTAAIDASINGWHRTVFAHHPPIWVIYACISHVLPIVSLDKSYGDALPGQIAGPFGKAVFHIVTLCGWLLGGMLAAGLSGLTQRPK